MNRVLAVILSTCLTLLTSEAGFVVNKGTFWQITDIHLDPYYSETGNIHNECHDNVSTASIGRYGNFSCDAPWMLVKEAIRAIKAIEPNPDFILWTGDSTAHIRTVELKWEKIYANLENITDLLLEAFPSSLIIPVIGNHDSFPANDFPYDNVKAMYQGYLSKAKWGQLIPPERTRTFCQGGYYDRDINPKLKILVLNTNLYLTYNTNRTEEDDPTEQLAWLKTKLEEANENESSVIIAAHVPPGYFERMAIIPFMNDKFNDAYVNLLLNYSSVILTQIYGHTHTDSFRIMSSDLQKGALKTHAFIAPSVSPWKVPATGMNGVNPSVRLYRYNLQRNMVLDYEQYYLNLTEANRAAGISPGVNTIQVSQDLAQVVVEEEEEGNTTQEPFDISAEKEMSVGDTNTSVKWELLYRATTFYGVNNLGLSSLAEIYRKIVNDPEVFKRYYEMNTVGVQGMVCDNACYQTHICAMRYITTPTIRRCLHPKHHNADATTDKGTTIPTVFTDTTEDSGKKHHHHHRVSAHMTHIIIGIAITLVVTLTVVAFIAVRRWRFRSSYRYKRHFSIQS